MEPIHIRREACITEILEISKPKRTNLQDARLPMNLVSKKVIDDTCKKHNLNPKNIAQIMQFDYLYATVLENVTRSFNMHFKTHSRKLRKSYESVIERFTKITGMHIHNYTQDIYEKVRIHDDLEVRIEVMNQFIKRYLKLK